MSEGGFLAWKRQEINSPPIADYSNLQKPMQLPKGSAWHLDPQTREWQVVKVEDNEDVQVATPIAEAVPTEESEDSPTGEVQFITHVVQSTDTMQGICLKVCIELHLVTLLP